MNLLTRLTFFLALSVGLLPASQAQLASLEGTWTLDVKGSTRVRAMVITRQDDALGVRFGFLEPGARLGSARASLDASGTLTLKTNAESTVILTPVDASTMRGTFTPRDGRPSRATAVRSTSEAIASVMGSGLPSRSDVGHVAPARLQVEANAEAPPAADVHFIWMGGNDCPPCVVGEPRSCRSCGPCRNSNASAIPMVTKSIQSAVPPAFFLPPEVQPFKELLDAAGAGTPGSPQAAVIVNGRVHDYFWGVRSAEEIESMLRSIRTGSVPVRQMSEIAPESRKCGVAA